DAAGVFHFSADEDPNTAIAFDGMWTIIFGYRGFVGLALLYLILELPAMLFVRNFPVRLWGHPRVAAASLAATLLGLYTIDCTFNGYINIIYVSLAGGLIGLRPVHLGIGPQAGRGSVAAGRPTGPRLRRAGITRLAGRAAGVGIESTEGSRRPQIAGKAGLADRYRNLGRSLKEQGRLAEAEAAWRQALDLWTARAATPSDAV